MGRFDGKTLLVTGAARGQGRSHAVRLAAEGADVNAVDRCADIATVAHPLATPPALNTVQAAAPVLVEQRRSGAVVLTSSALGLTGRGGSGRGGGDGFVAS
ncbi:hypothetical protein [Geodermatophilus sp. SYSU D00815]